MITRTGGVIAGTLAIAGALVSCSSTPAPTSSTATPPAVAQLVAAHPGCAGKVDRLDVVGADVWVTE